ncbi:MAG: radical SAM protein [Betaproteobacteria bacterium]|nr:radical SAM protein [Betaproteobacteria bacterium]
MVEKQLSFDNHNRDILGLTYVYPVVSRRAAGVSLGINLNTNHACNWACVYCQVPNLKRGAAPATDLEKLRSELDLMLSEVLEGRFMEAYVSEGLRRLNDIAFSGNGEPTSADYFEEAVAIAIEALRHRSLTGKVKLVVITNGSFALQPDVQRAFRAMADAGGEIWFKADRGRAQDILRINQVNLGPELLLKRLAATAEACPTWIQTCMTAWDGAVPDEAEKSAYLNLLQLALKRGIPIRGVLLYSLARPSHQPEAARIAAVPPDWLEALGNRIRALGLEVKVTP